MVFNIETWPNLVRQRILKYIGSQRYLTIQLDITNACNLRCAHCYHPHHRNEGAIGFDQWKTILDQYNALLNKLGLLPAITLCGGEPLISPLLMPMLTELDRRWPGVPLTILTNGTVIRDDAFDLFRRLGVHFQVSLDGPDSSRHDVIRGTGNFDRAVRGIRRFREQGLSVHILSILSKKTAAWIPDFFELASGLEVTSMNFTRLIPEGYGASLTSSGNDRPLNPLELRDAYASVVEHSRRFAIPTNTDQPLFHLIDPTLGGHGRLGFQGLIIDYKGNLKLSSRASYILGNIFSEGLEKLFLKHPVMQTLRDGKIEVCGSCEHFSRCGGYRTAAYAASGSFLGPDPGCWLKEEQQTRRIAQ